ncbi:uncharacterized protein HMPREF1541_00756 [Cyphellophora europaea CBS 101466]|uniref:DNA polymerase V n=1 Tax=Cyphellophora europaea (strain CBS 101466) TaxID=1220924 RepID=W2SCW8_CYPE1|nr:uncharacterized protein HMPREF1541_00756 [Cyphellophora europaea CBS 101466]ETN46571.1 hypothetical protein HMPREF1541_00756 [Cyphellophora europaea CBS 101466]
MSKKRKRDVADVDVEVVNIYDKLASEDETTRLNAARQLLTKTFQDGTTTEDQINTILKRLFRGLCSSRKAARLGFVVALTEFLSQLQASPQSALISPAKAIDILESTTTPEGGSRGQDERDHYFGRVFGADAVIKSKILFADQDQTQWKRLLELVCQVAMKKPWLRQECGYVLCQLTDDDSEHLIPFVEEIINTLNAHKLIRTPEGVAVWLMAKRSYPKAKLSKHVWKHSHPLAKRDVQGLAEVMKNARSQQPDAEFGAQGSTSWNSSLHFAWKVVLNHFYEQFEEQRKYSLEHKDDEETELPGSRDLIGLKEFWETVVEGGLFGANSSTERKLWGVLAVSHIASTAPVELIPAILTERTLHYLLSSLNGEDRYLRKSSQSALQALEKCFKSTVWMAYPYTSQACLRNIINATKYIDFDAITKTKTVTALLDDGNARDVWIALTSFEHAAAAVAEDDERSKRLKYIFSLESKFLGLCLRRATTDPESFQARSLEVSIEIFERWLAMAKPQVGVSLPFPSIRVPEALKQYLRDRIAAGLEHSLKEGPLGRQVFKSALTLYNLKIWEVDHAISQVLNQAEKRLQKLEKAYKKQHLHEDDDSLAKKGKPTSLVEGFQLLYSLVAFDIYSGEHESVEIMQELLDMEIPGSRDTRQATDPLVEILLSFSSRPSKFLRTLTPIIFESLASGLTADGLRSLTRVLAAKENAQGQLEMFEAAGEDAVEEDEDSSEGENSDVEVVDASEGTSDSDDSAESGEEASSAEDEELAVFDAVLASALGKARANEESGTDSDEDMDDDQMMELDEKLTEVFKAQKEASSKKKDKKDAKETVINFKNRVLDLIDVYVKHEHQNPHVTEIILPLLQTIRTTQTKQIAERANKILRDLCTRCKGQQNSPLLETSMVKPTTQLLADIHTEACVDASNNHAAAASQASILVVKTLIKSGVDIEKIIHQYGETMTKMMTEPKCKVQPAFFTDWNNWCASARSWMVKQGGAKA